MPLNNFDHYIQMLQGKFPYFEQFKKTMSRFGFWDVFIENSKALKLFEKLLSITYYITKNFPQMSLVS